MDKKLSLFIIVMIFNKLARAILYFLQHMMIIKEAKVLLWNLSETISYKFTSENIRPQSENILIAFSSQSPISHKIPIGFLDLKIPLKCYESPSKSTLE